MNLFNDFIIKHNTNFLNLSLVKQDEYKIENYELLEPLFSNYIYKKLFNVTIPEYDFINEEEPEELAKLTSLDSLNRNIQSQYLSGIGVNKFSLNESMADDETILTFKTLYDYDYDNHVYQEKSTIEHTKNINVEDISDSDIPEYKMRLNGCWARMIDNENCFQYLLLYSSPSYIRSIIEESLSSYIDLLIPNEIDFNFSKSNSVINVQAKGKEDLLDYLKHESYELLFKIEKELFDFFDDNKLNKIWSIKNNNQDKTDPSVTLIFSNKEVLQKINLNNFDTDVEHFKTEDLSYLKKKAYTYIVENQSILLEKMKKWENK
jgi:hypothetical protein